MACHDTYRMSLVKKLAKKFNLNTQTSAHGVHGPAELPWWSPERWAYLWNGEPQISAASAATANTMLPVLIEVFAAFSKLASAICAMTILKPSTPTCGVSILRPYRNRRT